MPGLMVMISRWSPKAERARMGAIVFGGAQIGNIAGTYFSGLIMHNGAWDNVFYMFGGIGIIWFLLWVSIFSIPWFIDSQTSLSVLHNFKLFNYYQ